MIATTPMISTPAMVGTAAVHSAVMVDAAAVHSAAVNAATIDTPDVPGCWIPPYVGPAASIGTTVKAHTTAAGDQHHIGALAMNRRYRKCISVKGE